MVTRDQDLLKPRFIDFRNEICLIMRNIGNDESDSIGIFFSF